MRILLVNDSARYLRGGANRVAVETSNLLLEAGHEVGFAFCDHGPVQVECPTFRFSASGALEADHASLGAAVRAFKPDLIQVHWLDYPNVHGLLGHGPPECRYIHDQSWYCSGGHRMDSRFNACHRPHAPACLLWHYLQGCGGKNPWGNWTRWKRSNTNFKTLKHPEIRLQVASRYMAAGLEENGFPPTQIDLVRLYSAPPGGNAPNREPGLIVAATRLVHGKGADVLLRALGTRALRARSWSLILAGEGPDLPRLRQLAADQGIGSQVEFPGEVSPGAVSQLFSRASIIVHPTVRPEPFGLVGPEAMSHARPVIAFDDGATPEWLEDGLTGILVREKTPEALAQAIQALLDNPDLAGRMGDVGHQRWSQFTPERYLGDLLASFEKTIAGAAHSYS